MELSQSLFDCTRQDLASLIDEDRGYVIINGYIVYRDSDEHQIIIIEPWARSPKDEKDEEGQASV